jgi:hypothetical protein
MKVKGWRVVNQSKIWTFNCSSFANFIPREVWMGWWVGGGGGWGVASVYKFFI